MTSFLLPLHFTNLDGLEKRQLDFIQESVKVASAHTGKLIIAIECEELQRVKVMDSVWEKVQAFLGNVYVAQLIACYKLDDPLFECNVVFQDVCGYKVHLEPYMTHVFETGKYELY
jgi:pantetheine-phosphate adenylyltransferase